MANYENLKDGYQKRWDEMEITRPQSVDSVAKRILNGMKRYKAISKLLGNGIPPEVIGVIHMRESDLDFAAHLHNGDKPLSAPTRHVPRGRGPFSSFEESSVDALKLEGADKINNWDIPRQSWFLEKFNGFGYQGKRGGNPYLYGGTNEYQSGKFVRDGVYDPSFHDPQLGVMAILKQLSKYGSNYRETRDDVVKNSTKLTLNKRIRSFFVWVCGGGLTLSSAFQTTQPILQFVKDNGLWFVAGAGILMFLILKYFEYKSVDDHLQGNYTPSGMVEEEDTEHVPPVKADVVHTESVGAASDSGASAADNSGAAGNG